MHLITLYITIYTYPVSVLTQVLSAAEVMVRQKMRGEGNGVSPLSLSLRAVRALYALQIEMDALLTPYKAAMLRVWADNRYREQRAQKKAQDALLVEMSKDQDRLEEKVSR